MNNLIIKRSQLVRAKITGTPTVGNQYFYSDVPNISRNNCLLYGFEMFTATQLSKTPQNETVVAASTVDQIVLTWRDNKKQEYIYQMAAYTAVRSLNGGFIVLMKPRLINLTDSYIQLTDTTGVNTNDVVAVNLYYDLIS